MEIILLETVVLDVLLINSIFAKMIKESHQFVKVLAVTAQLILKQVNFVMMVTKIIQTDARTLVK